VKNAYQTPARRALVDFFASHPDRHFTAEQICTLLCDAGDRPAGSSPRGEFIGKSTVYRQLSRLCAEGRLRRFEDVSPDGGAVHVYQYVPSEGCEVHFHLKCLRCGRVCHLECGQTDALLAHVRATHGFSVDCGSSILYGLCAACGGN
jgi:Fur family ferric uptake transcriptional regulator